MRTSHIICPLPMQRGPIALGAAALVAPRGTGMMVLMVCVIGAVGTFAAGCYQGAKAGAAMMALDNAPAGDGCAGSCASCTLSCS